MLSSLSLTKGQRMSDHTNCGHTEEEHAQMGQDMAEALGRGDITPLIQSLTMDNFVAALQACTTEIWVRAENDDEAEAAWQAHADLVERTFIDRTENDEFYQQVIAEREFVKNSPPPGLEFGALPSADAGDDVAYGNYL